MVLTLCGMDKYRATYHFLKKDKFILKYDIIGPKNNYTVKTEFEKGN